MKLILTSIFTSIADVNKKIKQIKLGFILYNIFFVVYVLFFCGCHKSESEEKMEIDKTSNSNVINYTHHKSINQKSKIENLENIKNDTTKLWNLTKFPLNDIEKIDLYIINIPIMTELPLGASEIIYHQQRLDRYTNGDKNDSVHYTVKYQDYENILSQINNIEVTRISQFPVTEDFRLLLEISYKNGNTIRLLTTHNLPGNILLGKVETYKHDEPILFIVKISEMDKIISHLDKNIILFDFYR